MRVKQDQLESLRKALSAREMYGEAGIAKKAKLSEGTTRRMMRGDDIGEEHFYKLFRAYFGLPEGQLDERRTNEVHRLMGRYCEPEPGAVVRAAAQPRTARAAPRSGGPTLACMVVVLKFVYLRDRRKGIPAYIRPVARLDGEAVAVYSEYFSVRTLYFRDAPKSLTLKASRKHGTVDMQPVLPPGLTLGGDAGQSSLVRHTQEEPGPLSQVAVTILNGIQADGDFEGSGIMGALVPEKCDRVILVVDMLSIPVKPGSNLHAVPPTAWHKVPVGQIHEDTHIGCAESQAGVFVVDTAEAFGEPDAAGAWQPGQPLQAGEQVVIHFTFNWDALA